MSAFRGALVHAGARTGSAIAALAAIGLFALLGTSFAFASPNLYVSMSDGVGVLDAADDSVRYMLPGGTAWADATLSADHTRLYVLDPIDGMLRVFDTRSRALLRTYLLTGRPLAIAVPADDARVYVGLERLRSGEVGAVQVIDTRLGRAAPAVEVPYSDFMEVSPDASTMYLQADGRCGVVALDTNDFSEKASGTSFCDAEDAAIVSPDGATLYVNALYGAIDVFDAATLEMRFRIAMPWAGGDTGSPMAMTRDGTELVVGSAANGIIAFVDTVHGVLETTTASCLGATGIAFSPDERFVYVLCEPSFDGAVLDARTHALLRTFPAGSYPSARRKFAGDPPVPLYVVDGSESGDVVAIDSLSHSLGAPARVGRAPEGVVTSPDGRRLYVSNGADNTVSVVNADVHSEVATIAVGRHPTGLALSPDGARLYVANTDDDSISVIDTPSGSVVSTFPVDADSKPRWLAMSADGAKLYIALSNWVYVAVYDTAAGTLSAPIYCPSGVSSLVIAPDGATAYVASAFSGDIYRIDVASDTVTDTWDVGIDVTASPHPIAVSPDSGRIYVGRANDDALPGSDAFLIAVDAGSGSVLSWWALADTATSIAVEPEGRFLYAALPGTDSVEIVDTTTSGTVETIGGFHSPVAIAPPVEPVMDTVFGSGFD